MSVLYHLFFSLLQSAYSGLSSFLLCTALYTEENHQLTLQATEISDENRRVLKSSIVLSTLLCKKITYNRVINISRVCINDVHGRVVDIVMISQTVRFEILYDL